MGRAGGGRRSSKRLQQQFDLGLLEEEESEGRGQEGQAEGQAHDGGQDQGRSRRSSKRIQQQQFELGFLEEEEEGQSQSQSVAPEGAAFTTVIAAGSRNIGKKI